MTAGATELKVDFAAANTEKDASYGVLVECSWLTLKAITEKTTSGFKVIFGTAAPAGGKLDWLLVR